MKPLVSIAAQNETTIYYTIDGSEPNKQSKQYTAPFELNESATVKAMAIPNNSAIIKSSIASIACKTYQWMNTITVAKTKPGIAYKYYEQNEGFTKEFEKKQPKTTGVTDVINLNQKQRTEKFAFVFEGYIKISKDGVYTFFTESDDGSLLYIDDMLIVDNDGNHGNMRKRRKPL